MTGRERIEGAFTSEGTRDFGAVICYEGIFIRDHWDEVTDRPWWVMHSPDVDAQVLFFRDRIERIGQDWFTLPEGMPAAVGRDIQIEERASGVYRFSRSTGVARELIRPAISGWRPGGGCHSVHPERPPLTPEAVDEQVPLAAPFDPAHPLPTGVEELPRRILQGPGRDVFPIGYVGSPLWGTYDLWGFEGMMRMLADDPALVEYACERLLARARQSIAWLAAVGVRGVWIEECLTDMIHPSAFRRFNVPYVRALAEAVREAGMLSVYYYCGNPNDRLDLLLDCGADALSLEEGKKGFRIDVADVVDAVQGRCVLLGNLDAIDLLAHGSEAALRAEIARQLTAGRRNRSRFVMSIGSPVTPETPLRRVRLYTDLVHELGRG